MTLVLGSKLVGALCVVHLLPFVLGASGFGDVGTQHRLINSDCLPGPLKMDAYPTCVDVNDGNDSVSWRPWTYPPYCADGSAYCVFTSTDFQGPGRGLSLIDMQPTETQNATTSAVKSLAHLLSSLPPPNTAGETSPPYDVRDIPGKGKGLVAIRKISRGQTFMVDYAAVVADQQFPTRVRREQGRHLLREAIHRLPAADEVLSLARSSSDPDNVPAVEDVLKTNSFSVEIAGKVYMALFPRIAVSNSYLLQCVASK